MPELLRLRGEFEARGGDPETAEAVSSVCALAETAGGVVLAAANGDVACAASASARPLGALAGVAETFARFSEGFETAE